MKIGHVRLHDPDGARFRIPDAKTETGISEVQMTPALVEAVVDHLDRLHRADYTIGDDDYLVQSRRTLLARSTAGLEARHERTARFGSPRKGARILEEFFS